MESNQELKQSLTDELRDDRRNKLKEHQEFSRLKAFDCNRFIDSDDVLTEKDIAGLCSRIKRRKHASEEDLIRLSNAFIQSELNISAFIKTTGAVNIVVKELTGSDNSRKLLAAQCLCNLSLGDEICCFKLATFAGSYIMILTMESTDAALSRICVWIAQNIVAAGNKSMNILMSQDLLKNCLHMLNESMEQNILDAARLLDIIIDMRFGELKIEEQEEVRLSVWNLLKKRSDDPMALQIFYKVAVLNGPSNICSSSEDTSQLLNLLVRNFKDGMTDEFILHFTTKVLLAVLQQNQEISVKIVEFLIEQDVKLSALINAAAANPKFFSLVKEITRFISILLTCPTQSSRYFNYDPIENIKIPKVFEF